MNVLFCALVKMNKTAYNQAQRVSSLLMILTLLWLTVSAPFVFSSQQQRAQQQKESANTLPADNEEETSNPFGNNTEEKNPTSTNFSEEYLHDSGTYAHTLPLISAFNKYEKAALYVAFHGELLVPPPNHS
jgi:hypothetical protein